MSSAEKLSRVVSIKKYWYVSHFSIIPLGCGYSLEVPSINKKEIMFKMSTHLMNMLRLHFLTIA